MGVFDIDIIKKFTDCTLSATLSKFFSLFI